MQHLCYYSFSIQVEAPEISAGSLVLSPAHRGSPTTEEEQPDPAYDVSHIDARAEIGSEAVPKSLFSKSFSVVVLASLMLSFGGGAPCVGSDGAR